MWRGCDVILNQVTKVDDEESERILIYMVTAWLLYAKRFLFTQQRRLLP